MNKIIGILKKWKNQIKLVLFMSIGSLVIIEIIRMFRSISIDEVTSTIGTIAPEKVLFLFVLGFAAVSPMILYDYILNKELKQSPRLSYLIETSWTINTLNNMIGFAGQRVIAQTIGEKLPEGFQAAEFLLEHGFIDKIVKREELKDTLSTLIKFHKGGIQDGKN